MDFPAGWRKWISLAIVAVAIALNYVWRTDATLRETRSTTAHTARSIVFQSEQTAIRSALLDATEARPECGAVLRAGLTAQDLVVSRFVCLMGVGVKNHFRLLR